MAMELEGLIPLPDAAQRLGISWERAWRKVLAGELEGQKVAGRWVVTERSVEKVRAERDQSAA